MLEWLSFHSQAIRDFPMGDHAIRRFPVYLPPQYDEKRQQAYPVVYMLAGFGARGAKLLADDSVYSEPLESRLDNAINDKKLAEVIVVFPDGGSKFGCSQYINSPALGHYMDYIADELVEFIDERYHTHATASGRGVMGHSSGGFGALVMGMLRPDRFHYICSSAGDSFYDVSLLPSLKTAITELEKHGGITEFCDWFFNLPSPSHAGGAAFQTMLTLGMAPCYAPNLNKPPLYGDLFFDLKTGRVIDEVWQKYLAWDPVNMVERYLANLRKLKWIHLEHGLQDEYALQLGQRQIAEKLNHYDIAYHLEEYPGGHSGHHWRNIQRLALMLENMQA